MDQFENISSVVVVRWPKYLLMLLHNSVTAVTRRREVDRRGLQAGWSFRAQANIYRLATIHKLLK